MNCEHFSTEKYRLGRSDLDFDGFQGRILGGFRGPGPPGSLKGRQKRKGKEKRKDEKRKKGRKEGAKKEKDR